MFTIQFDARSKKPKYEQLYQYIKKRIALGDTVEGERLPSKRKLAMHLNISLNTVENAYAQLLAEGFVESSEKRGYYVMPLVSRTYEKPRRRPTLVPEPKPSAPGKNVLVLRNNAVDTASFPFATWSRLMRDSLSRDHARLVHEAHPQGDRQLRDTIASYLLNYRNMNVSPGQIVIGAGSTYLLGMMTELLPGFTFALEEPGYFMLARTLQSRNVPFACIPVDGEGMDVQRLEKSGASLCIVTPSNQFPLCLVMSIKRRLQLLEWAHCKPDRYIIEDDYDSDYRYSLKPAPALHSLDDGDRVIYFNTFARTLTPSLRIAYMVLPQRLMESYRFRRYLYSCTVSGFEQRTLWRFLVGGHYERHLNRMRTIYKRRRNALLQGLEALSKQVRISGTEAGLHLLLHSIAGIGEEELVAKAAEKKVAVFGLSGFFHQAPKETNTVIAGYGGLSEQELKRAATRLHAAWKK